MHSFADVPQALIEAQQTDVIAQAMGGPSRYSGKMVVAAHMHVFITEEFFEARSQMLESALVEAGVPEALRVRWLKIDSAFKGRLVKGSVSECQGRYRTEPIGVIQKPAV
jgi:hypothetical protein